MKRIAWVMKKIETCRDIPIVTCFALFVLKWRNQTEYNIIGILGGISDFDTDRIEIIQLGKWLFLFAFYFWFIERKLEKDRKIITFKIYRYGRFQTWWKYHYIKMHWSSFCTYGISCLIWMVAEFGKRGCIKNEFAVILVFFLHLSLWMSILILCDILVYKKIVICILLLAEGLTYIFSVNFKVPCLAFGMYARSSGLVAIFIYMLEVFGIIGCYITGLWLWKKGWLERIVV